MTAIFSTYLWRALLPLFAAFSVAGCVGNGGDLVPVGSFAAPVTIVPHYGRGIGIPEAYLNGGYIGSAGGWGGGGGGNCCVSMKVNSTESTMVTVKWRTLRSSVDESRWHEETVPVH